MNLFNKDMFTGPVFYKDDSEAERQLEALKKLLPLAKGKVAEDIEQEIRLVEAGIVGENQVKYELTNSHIPMYVLHDLYLEHEGLTAQIDYLIITKKHQYVIECKNLYGNIEINSDGNFIRTTTFGGRTKKEGIYSPITQNRRHLEIIKSLRTEEHGLFTRSMFENNFFDNYRSVVVLSNPKTVLNAKYAKKEVRSQVVRADQLAEYIRKVDASSDSFASSKSKVDELAGFFLAAHKQHKVDYTERFTEAIKAAEAEEIHTTDDSIKNAQRQQETQAMVELLCPKCGKPMVLRTAKTGTNAGKQFYGCSNYPKCRGIVSLK